MAIEKRPGPEVWGLKLHTEHGSQLGCFPSRQPAGTAISRNLSTEEVEKEVPKMAQRIGWSLVGAGLVLFFSAALGQCPEGLLTWLALAGVGLFTALVAEGRIR